MIYYINGVHEKSCRGYGRIPGAFKGGDTSASVSIRTVQLPGNAGGNGQRPPFFLMNMNTHVVRNWLLGLKEAVSDSFKVSNRLINVILRKDKADHSACLESINDILELKRKHLSDYFDVVIESLDESDIPKEQVNYHYILVTVHDNDYFKTMECLGELLVHGMGEYISDHKFDVGRLKESIPNLFWDISSLCQARRNVVVSCPHPEQKELISNLCQAHRFNPKDVVVLCTEDEIIDYMDTHGMGDKPRSEFVNQILKDDPKFKDIVHLDGDYEVLIVRLACDKSDGSYVESLSDWAVV